MRRYLGRLLYYDLPEWVFTAAYIVLAGAVALTFMIVKPRARRPDRSPVTFDP